MICNPSYKKGSTYQTWGFAIPPVRNDLHLFNCQNLHDSKNCRIFAAKDRNRRKDYGKQ